MTEGFIPIQYRDFCDVPRMFIFTDGGTTFLFDGSFDESIGDYPDAYTVSVLPELMAGELSGSWDSMPSRAIRKLNPVPVSAVKFDVTRRQSVERFSLSVVISEQEKP